MDISVLNLSKDHPKNAPNPVRTFHEAFEHYRKLTPNIWGFLNNFTLCQHIYTAEILREIEKNKFVKPTPIQVCRWSNDVCNLEIGLY